MDHCDTYNTVDSVFAFRVVEAAAVTDVSSCSVSVWRMKWSLRKFAAYVSNVFAFIFIYLPICGVLIIAQSK